MKLEEVLDQWKNEVKELFVGLNNLERQKQAINNQIKESDLGKQKKEIMSKIKEVKRMVEQRRFEVSGLEKAIFKSKAPVKQKTGKLVKFG